MPTWRLCFHDGEIDGFLPICLDVCEDSTVSNDNSQKEEHSTEVSWVRTNPGCRSVFDCHSAVEKRGCHEHYVRCEQISTGEDNHYEADGEHQGTCGLY